MTNKVSIIEVEEQDNDRRIDNFLFTMMKNVPKSRIYRAIRKGEIRVNKKRVKADSRLFQGDQVRIPPITVPETVTSVAPSDSLVSLLKSRIIYEDERVIVVNKPAGIAVHGGSGIRMGVIEALRNIYPTLQLELAHRLDRDTSGCLIVAKRRSAVRHLHQQLREGTVKKIYHCFIKGYLPSKTIIVDKPLYKNQLVSGERIVKVDMQQGKPSKTIFTELQAFESASYVQAELKTGRTHQIRVHAACLGCPLAGDPKYGDKTFNSIMKQQGLNRLFLHAYHLAFISPMDDKKVNITAPLDEPLQAFLSDLSKQ